MRLSRSMALALPAACTLRAPRRIVCPTRRSTLVVRAQQPDGTPTSPAAAAPPPAAAAAPQQALPVVVTVSSPEQPQHAAFDDEMVAAAESDFTSIGKTAAAEQQAASVRQAVGTPAQPKGSGGLPFGLSLQPPWVRAAAVVGAALAVYLSGTLLLTLFRMGRDPQKKRGKTINKNKMVVDSISKFLPGRREALNPGSFRLLKLQTGFSSVEVFRKYLWFLLRERQYDAEALADLVALKGALGLTDDQVAEALLERAQRVYEKYGAVMVNMEGLSQAGIERKAATRNLFMKLKSLTEAQELLSPQAAAAVDLGKVFGVTQRDILTLSSGYSAEEEGSALQDDSEGEGGVAA